MEPGKRDQVNLIWVLGGLYLIYTGGEMLYRIAAGEAELLVVSGLGGLAFLVIGGVMLCRECMSSFSSCERRKRSKKKQKEERLKVLITQYI